MNKSYILFIILIAVLAGCSVNSRYNEAHRLYMASNYPTAIELYDRFLEIHSEGAFATRAELERSDSYYQLGYRAFEKENWILASRLFYLANSDIADSKLDECYRELAIEAIAQQDTAKAMEYYSYIISYLTTSELLPEMLYNRILIYLAQNKNLLAFNDYHQLWMKFPESDFRQSIQAEIDVLLPDFLKEAYKLRDNGDYDDALDICFRLSQYPSKLQDDIISEIANLYWLKAESEFTEANLQQARIYWDKVYEYSPQRKNEILEHIENISQQYIQEGQNLEVELKFDAAVSAYQKCFQIVPDHSEATAKIAEAKETKARYLQAMNTMYEAKEQERIKQHKKALDLYKQSNSLFQTEEAKHKIFIMQNVLEAEKDPKGFAQRIVNGFKRGLLISRVARVQNHMLELYGDAVKPSGWKVTYSIGLYKYEVRYDLLSSYGNFYFAWRVDLKNKTVSPSNKISELLMTDLDAVLAQIE